MPPAPDERSRPADVVSESGASARTFLRVFVAWVSLGALVGVICGAVSAFFLWALDGVTAVRGAHRALVYALPLAGLAIGFLYERLGRPI